jgi:hypothetical protein
MTIEPQNLRGRLDAFCFPDLLVSLHKVEASGILSVTAGPVTRQVFFRAGLATAARSNVRSERLGELLLAGRVITPEQHAQARRLQQESQSTVASALLALEAISRHDLFVWTRRQFVGIVLSLFSLTEGEYRFDQNELAGDRYCFEVDFPELLALGIRSIKNVPRLRQLLGDFEQVPAPTNRFPEHRRIAFNADELPVIRRIDGARTIAKIVDTSGAELPVALKTLLVFRFLGFISLSVEFREEEMVETAAPNEAKPAPMASLDVEAAIAGDDFLVPPTVIPLSHYEAAGASSSSDDDPQREASDPGEGASTVALAAQLKSVRPEKGGWLDTLIGDGEQVPEGRETSGAETPEELSRAETADAHPWTMAAPPAAPQNLELAPTEAIPPATAMPLDTPPRGGFPWTFTAAALIAALGISLVAFTPWGAGIRDRLFAEQDREATSVALAPQTAETASPEPQNEALPAVEEEKALPAPPPASLVEATKNTLPASPQEERSIVASAPLPAAPEPPPAEEKPPLLLAKAPLLAAVQDSPPPMPTKKAAPVEPEAPVAAAAESVAPQAPAPEQVLDLTRVLDLTHETGENFVRVEIMVDRPIDHGKYVLPERNIVYVSLRKTHLPRSFENTSFRVNSDLVRNVRIAQFDQDTTRVVLTCRGLPLVSVFHRENPHRVVLLVTPE